MPVVSAEKYRGGPLRTAEFDVENRGFSMLTELAIEGTRLWADSKSLVRVCRSGVGLVACLQRGCEASPTGDTIPRKECISAVSPTLDL